MLFKIFDNLRTKPKYVRDQYAFGIAVFCTLAIGGVWALSLPARFNTGSQVAALASTTNAAPFANFFTQLKHQFTGVKEAIENTKTGTSTPLSIASSTEAALDLKLTDENKDALTNSSTTDSGTRIQFGTGSRATSTSDEYSKTVIVASGTATTSQKR